MVVHPVPRAPLVDVVEKARRGQMKKWGLYLASCICALSGFALVGGHGKLGSLGSNALGVAAFLAVGFGVFEFLVRPKPVPVADGVFTGFFTFKMLATKFPDGRIRIVPFSGRLIFVHEGLTWVPSAKSRRCGLGTVEWRRADIVELRVEQVRNLTPLGYLHLRSAGSAEVVFRVFQSKRLRPIASVFVSLAPPHSEAPPSA
jgi:hypothetical protein